MNVRLRIFKYCYSNKDAIYAKRCVLHVARSKNVANFIFSTLTTSEFKLEDWRFNHRNLSVNIPNMLPRNMSSMSQNRSADLKEYWKILFSSGRLLDNQAPRRVKQAWQGGIFISPDLSRLAPPHVIPSNISRNMSRLPRLIDLY